MRFTQTQYISPGSQKRPDIRDQKHSLNTTNTDAIALKWDQCFFKPGVYTNLVMLLKFGGAASTQGLAEAGEQHE